MEIDMNSEKKNRSKETAYLIRVIAAWILVLCWMAFIFAMSAETVEESKETSTSVSAGVAGSIVPDYEELPAEKQEETVASYDVTIRKLAHFCEFGLLGVLLYGAIMITRNTLKQNLLIAEGAAFIALLYAASDEIHQQFVPGRMSLLKDFAIDCLGALCGVLGLMLLLAVVELILKRKQKL